MYSRALDLLPAGNEKCFDLLAARADAYDIIANREAQLADIEAMLSLAEAEENETRQIDALLALASLYIEIDKFKVKEPAEKALELSRKIGDIAREDALIFFGMLAMHNICRNHYCAAIYKKCDQISSIRRFATAN